MLRKLSQRFKKRESDEFVSVDAARLERAESKRRAEQPPRPTPAPVQAKGPPRHSWEAGDEQNFVSGRAVEALMLEPIIAPTLRRMMPTVATREALAAPPDRRRPPMHIDMPPRAWLPPSAEPGDLVLLSQPVPGITITPAERRINPFDELAKQKAKPQPEVVQVPRRPPLRRQAVSYRTQRDLPLRVQAVRRAHQEQFARRLTEDGPMFAPPRRKSAPNISALPVRATGPSIYPEVDSLRPVRPLLPQHTVRRSQSDAHLGQVPKRSPSNSAAAKSPQQERDFYIEAAEMLWQLPSPEGRSKDIP